MSATHDRLDTGWQTSLTGSWTISFVIDRIESSANLYYIFGDLSAGAFRCFTNGVAGPGNWILRGTGFSEVIASGGAAPGRHRTTFVHDSGAGVIHAYVDGALVSSVDTLPPVISSSDQLTVMGHAHYIGAPAGGLLDDFRVYSRALSAAEIADIDMHALVGISGDGQAIAVGGVPSPANLTDFGKVVLGGDVVHTFAISNTGAGSARTG